MIKGKETKLRGIILESKPMREYDKVLQVLTDDLGRITVWASGVKKQNSPLASKTNILTVGDFFVTENKGGYSLKTVDLIKDFYSLTSDLEKMYYASYFLEVAKYFSNENIPAKENVRNIYYALLHLDKGNISSELIRGIFELRSLVIEGTYKSTVSGSKGFLHAWEYVTSSEVNKIYNFNLTEECRLEFCKEVDIQFKSFVNKKFQTLELLESVVKKR